MIDLKINITIPEIDPQAFRRVNLPKILGEEMLTTKRRIQADAIAGRKADGGSLKRYSPGFIEEIDSGRVYGKTPGDHTPNLHQQLILLYEGMPIEPLPNGSKMSFQGMHPPAPDLKPGQRARAKREPSEKNRQRYASSSRSLEVKAVRSTGLIRVKGPKPLKGNRPRRKTSVPNAEIAAKQYAMGRSGWFCFSRQDIDRIANRVRMEFWNAVSAAFVK